MVANVETSLTYPEELALFDRQDLYLRLASTVEAESVHSLIASNWDYLEEFQHLDETDPSLEAVTKALDQTIQDMNAGKGVHYVVTATRDDKPVGRVCLEEGRLGYWVGEEFQGSGYATSAAERLVSFGFEDLDLDKIIVRINDRNIKSQHVAKKLGARATSRYEPHVKSDHQIVYRVWEIGRHE